MDNRTPAEKLAFTLRYLIDKGCVPGLLPKDVEAAATMLVEQEKALALAKEALAAKDHVVKAEVEDEHYRKRIRGTFIITDPRIYHGEVVIDDRLAAVDPNYVAHVSRSLVAVATNDWRNDLIERGHVAVVKALAASADTLPKGGDYRLRGEAITARAESIAHNPNGNT